MSQADTLLHNPLFQWGMPAIGAAIAIGIALFVLEDRTVRIAIFVVAAFDMLVAPQVLKQVARNAESPPA